MTYNVCGNTYTNFDVSPIMYFGDWWDIPGSIYSLYQSIIGCDETPDATVLVYKNSRGTYLGSMDWSDSDTSFDSGGICISSWFLVCDPPPENVNWEVYFGLTNLNNVYVNSSTGNDSNAGSGCVVPVLTFQTAYNKMNSAGTIYICNDGADFSSENITFTKPYSTAQGAAGVTNYKSPRFN